MSAEKFSRIDPKLDELSEKWLKNPKSRVFAPLADAYRKSGMADEALKVCLEGLKIHPDYTTAHIVLGKIYLDQSKVNDAEQEFLTALEKDPDNLVTLNNLGDIYRRLGRNLDALEKYERAHKLDPFNEELKGKLSELERFRTKAEVAGQQILSKPVSAEPDYNQVELATSQPQTAAEPPAPEPPPFVEEVATAPVEEVYTEEPVFTIETDDLEAEEPAQVEPVYQLDIDDEQDLDSGRTPGSQPEVQIEPALPEEELQPAEAEDDRVYDISEDVSPLEDMSFPTSPSPVEEEEEGDEQIIITNTPPPLDSFAMPESELEPTPEFEPIKETEFEPIEEAELPSAAVEPAAIEIESDLPPVEAAQFDEVEADDSDHGVETVTMARIYAKQGMVNKAKVICLKLLSADPTDEEAKKLLSKLQGAPEGEAVRITPAPVDETPEPEVTDAAPLATVRTNEDDEPLIDFRESSDDDDATIRSQTIFAGDIDVDEEEPVYRGTMMEFGVDEEDTPATTLAGSEDGTGGEPEKQSKSEVESWLDELADEEEDD